VAENAVDVPFSPFWWMKTLTDRQRKRLPRLNELAAWMDNNPPLPEGSAEWEQTYQSFHADTRTNLAALAVSSVRDPLTPLGFRTAATDDDNGDAKAAQVYADNNMPVETVDLLTKVFGLGEGYTMIGPPAEDSDEFDGFSSDSAIITVEDPRQVITAEDPLRRMRPRAGMKTLHDPDTGEDICYIYVKADPQHNPDHAVVYRAVKKSKHGTQWGTGFRLTPSAWKWDDQPILLRSKRLPIVHIQNRGGVAEFEPHLSNLRRINRITLQRMLIGEIQAFKQRAIEGLPRFYPEDFSVPELRGKEIDYEGVFKPGPGSLWMVPPGAKFWESQAIDLRPLLDEERLEYRTASALMGIPLSYFNPDDTNGSAEGASLQRQTLTFRAEDRKTIVDAGLCMTMSHAFEQMGDLVRAKLSDIEGIWAPIERLSLTERFNAAVQGNAAGLPQDTIRRYVLKMTPREMKQAEADDAKDMVLGRNQPRPDPMQVLSQRTDSPRALPPGRQQAQPAAPTPPAPQPPSGR